MNTDSYTRLADALDKLPNGFPRTTSNIELLILKKIFSPKEASLASLLCGDMEPVDTIAERGDLLLKEARTQLIQMTKRGLVWFEKRDGKPHFRLPPFIVGIYESQTENMDHELAHLFEEYMVEGGAVGIMRPQPALHRVIPARGSVKSEWILPYDDVRAVILAAKSFRENDCICRVQQGLLGHGCEFPQKMCLSFSSMERSPTPHDISQEEALALLDRSEEIGLVHTVSNIAEGLGYVCNCCGCCCVILRGITEWGIEDSVAYANYYAVIAADECTGCGICIERCQVQAISEQDDVAVVNREQCIGCGLCVTGCPDGVIHLQRKPDAEIVDPPVDFAAWKHERLHNRGLLSS